MSHRPPFGIDLTGLGFRGLGEGHCSAHQAFQFGSVSQTLSSLTIGAGATVTLTSGLTAFSGGGKSPGFGATVVPEPGSIGLLVTGALGVLARRRRPA